MKIISLNVEGGARYDPLVEYIRTQSKTTDVFCFQEVFRSRKECSGEYRTTLYRDISRLLPDFSGNYCLIQRGVGYEENVVDHPISFGLAMFIKKKFTINNGHFFIHRHRNALNDDFASAQKLPPCIHINQPEALQYGTITSPHKHSYTIAHLHAIWHPGDKHDTPARIEQSKKIIARLSRFSGKTVLCGDFNLMPDTESIGMIEQAGYRNLIKEYNIQDTRGPINHERYPDSPQYFADYAFVSKDVSVRDFTVPQVRISDHLPLELSINA